MRNTSGMGLIVLLLLLSTIVPLAVEVPTSVPGRHDYRMESAPVDPSHQFDPAAIFSNGTVFDDFSATILVDPWPADLAVGDFNNDGQRDVVVISNYTNRISIYNGTESGMLSPVPWRIEKTGMVDLRSVAVGDLDDDDLDDIVVSHTDVDKNPFITIFYQSYNFNPSSPFSKTRSLWQSEPKEVIVGKFNDSVHNAIAVVCQGLSAANDDVVDI